MKFSPNKISKASKKSIFIVMIIVAFIALLGVYLKGTGSFSESQDNNNLELAKTSAKEDLPRVKSLIADGADLNAVVEKDLTPLIYASKDGRLEVVKYLFSKGGNNINATDAVKDSALHLAVINNHLDVVKLLVANGADINLKDNDGYSQLAFATMGKSNYEIVKFLVREGADINSVDNRNFTPLIHAVTNGNMEIIKFLVNHDVDLNIISKVEDMNALDLAYSDELYKNPELYKKIIAYLKAHGAKHGPWWEKHKDAFPTE